MDNLKLAFTGAWQVLAAGLILGAGVPAMFALGIRSLAIGGVKEGQAPPPIGKVLATMCFGVVVLAIALGMTFIIASGSGYKFSFEHIIPTLVKK